MCRSILEYFGIFKNTSEYLEYRESLEIHMNIVPSISVWFTPRNDHFLLISKKSVTYIKHIY